MKFLFYLNKIWKILFYLFLLTETIIAAPVLIYNTENGRIIAFKQRANTPEYIGRPDVIIFNTATPNLPQCAMKYWIVDAGAVREMTAEEKAVIDAEEATLQKQIDADRKDLEKHEKMLTACILVLIDEGNITRSWITDFKTAVAASTSLADFKTRIASLPAMPQRTKAQAKTAIVNKYNTL